MRDPLSHPTAQGRAWASGRIVLQDGQRSLLFEDPKQVVTVTAPQDLSGALSYIEDTARAQGLYAAGFLTYEAASAYELATHAAPADGLPPLWFGLYEQPQELQVLATPYGTYEVGAWEAGQEWPAYRKAIEAIKSYIASGHTYQVNYTMPLRASFNGDPWVLYRDLTQSQQAQYMAYVDVGRYVICSASPELFFVRQGSRLHSRPMKGTTARGRTLAEDRRQADWLQASVKNRAENVMIVDMIRNDFGRIAEIGSVEVPELFTVERYPTLLQMTSTVSARSRASLAEIMRAMFPCASITGAPKVRTMEIIKELEPQARGIYTGTIGFMSPDGSASFNVAIRTVVIDREKREATYGVGGGIVWDSEAEQEYKECYLKAQILVQRRPSFALLETMRWTPREGYFLLDRHLDRLAQSAEYFDYPLNLPQIRERLAELSLILDGATRARLLVDQRGAITIEHTPLSPNVPGGALSCRLAAKPVSSDDIWLFHKTTQRRAYDEARAAHPEVDEVLLWNKDGELTEATFCNIVLDLDGRLLTPPVDCGLLDGTFRRHLLARGEIGEQRLTINDLHRCRKIYLVNSVRGWQEAQLLESN